MQVLKMLKPILVKVISMSVVPVTLRQCSSNTDVLTFALLDNCCQGFFITDKLIKKLWLSWIKTLINFKTLNIVIGTSFYGVKAVLPNDKGIQWVKLPKPYLREDVFKRGYTTKFN